MRIPTLIPYPERLRDLPTADRGRTRRRTAVALVLVAAVLACDGNPFAEGELAPRLSIALTGLEASANLETVLDLADNLRVLAELPDGSVVEESFEFSTDQEVIEASLTLPIQGEQAEVTLAAQFREGTEVVASASDEVVVRQGEANQAELALDPCAVPFLYTVGETVSGELTANDCDFSDHYRFELTEQASLILRHGQQSSRFGFLDATPSLGSPVSSHPIGFAGDGSRFILGPGSYSLNVTYPGPDETGPYEFTMRSTSPDINGCSFVLVTDGVRTTGTLTSSDCTAGEPVPTDSYFVWLEAGVTVTATISMSGSQTQAAIRRRNASTGQVEIKVHRQIGAGEVRLSYTAEERDYHEIALLGEPGASYSVTFEGP